MEIPTGYCVLNNKKAWQKEAYCLVPIQEEHILLIKNWRNEQMNVLRQKKPLSDDDQVAYYNEVIRPLFKVQKPDQILFSFLQGKTCIGYGGLVHINWSKREAELSFLVETKRAANAQLYGSDLGAFLCLIKSIAFEDLKLDRIFTETYDIRPAHIAVLEENGFVLYKRLPNFLEIGGQSVDSVFHECFRK